MSEPSQGVHPSTLHRRSFVAAAGLGLAGGAAALAPSVADARGRPRPRDLAALAVEKEVADVLLTERWARDMQQWDVMRDQFHRDSLVDISWIRTSGPEFVRLSKEGFEAGSRTGHVLSPVLVKVNGKRAVADTGSIIEVRFTLAGVVAFLTAFGRIVERIERRRGVWRISRLQVIYQFDFLTPENPAETIVLDAQRGERYRAAYRGLSYWVEATRGAAAVRDDLPGIDRPETIRTLYSSNAAWLSGGAA